MIKAKSTNSFTELRLTPEAREIPIPRLDSKGKSDATAADARRSCIRRDGHEASQAPCKCSQLL